MPRSKADKLLLPKRLGHRLAQRGAAVRRIRRLDRPHDPLGIVDRAQEGADLRVLRAPVERREPAMIRRAWDGTSRDVALDARLGDVGCRGCDSVMRSVDEGG